MRGSLPERCRSFIPSIGQELIGWPATAVETPGWGDCCSGIAGNDVGGGSMRGGSGVVFSTLTLVMCDTAGVLSAAEAGKLDSAVDWSV